MDKAKRGEEEREHRPTALRARPYSHLAASAHLLVLDGDVLACVADEGGRRRASARAASERRGAGGAAAAPFASGRSRDAPVSFLKPVRMPSEICRSEAVSSPAQKEAEEGGGARADAPSRRCCRTVHRGRSC